MSMPLISFTFILQAAKFALPSRQISIKGCLKRLSRATSTKKAEIIPKNLIRVMPA